jgi:CheY-like chemotaxis protein
MNPTAPPPTAPEKLSDNEKEFRADLNQKLRAPLNAIIGFAELVAMRPGNMELGEEGAAEQVPNQTETKPETSCDVLYIEDDPVNFMLVERILEFRPALKLLHARSGESGVELAQTHCPKLILLDLNLPDIHGSEVLRRLQIEPGTAKVPVVVLSADATPSQIERLLTAGARNYLTKPFDIDPFLAVVDEMVA